MYVFQCSLQTVAKRARSVPKLTSLSKIHCTVLKSNQISDILVISNAINNSESLCNLKKR